MLKETNQSATGWRGSAFSDSEGNEPIGDELEMERGCQWWGKRASRVLLENGAVVLSSGKGRELAVSW